MKKLSILSIGISGLIVACGTGTNNNSSVNYYSASNTSHYSIESGLNVLNESQLYINMITQYGTWQAPLTLVTNNNYTFNQNGATGTVTITANNLGISYNSTSQSWIDFATLETNVSTNIPNGTYNFICDQSNLSACSMVINNNNITVTEFSQTGQATTLCNTQFSQSNNPMNPYLYSFNCGVNAGAASGQWNIMPFTINNTTAIMVAEYNLSENINDDSTDEIAFQNIAIHPMGNYNYLYNGGSFSQGTGVSTAQFTVAGIINATVGTCFGSACGLIANQYYNANAATGFDWFNVNLSNNYNLTGNDAMKIYQDSFVGFYF